MKKILIVVGTTASGKSSFALEYAKQNNGVIINCDSRQIYTEIPILSACPTEAEEAQVPHEMYAFLTGTEVYSAMRFVDDTSRLLPFIESNGQTPIFVGGTGLYIDALINGMSPIPPICECVLQALKQKKKEKGIAHLYEDLLRKDPELAKHLEPTDSQRILRGLSVYDSTKKPLSYFQSLPKQKIIDREFEVKIISRPVDELYARIQKRIELMFEQGIINEVKNLLERNYPKNAPVLQSIGVAEIESLLTGEMTENEAKEQIFIKTRQYAKRQRTWFNRFEEKDFLAS
ncbi:MAG: tRNA (adenosine(37)-N6)-dimethylallyltransferase MiaA [Alphaproteobacteria bacterium]|nr:tRNA (adenosine(37)-N6)-dimethylallyltransferase MiaA [Alphaproteobacteria bacterium]